MRRFVIALALACALSGTALAGEIPSTGAPAPESDPGIIHMPGAPAPGDMGNGGLSALLTILDLVF